MQWMNESFQPVADLTPPLEDCKEEETAKERRVKKVLQTVKIYLDRATKDDLLWVRTYWIEFKTTLDLHLIDIIR